MGLERLVSILQDKTSNYDIDCFQPLFTKIAEHSTVGVYTGKVYDSSSDLEACLKDTAYRAIADHARTLSFALADGAVPNNEGRGYVLRRILRRATRYGQQVLGAPPGFFATLIPVVVETFGATYPELIQAQDRIVEIIQEEEQSFSSMLERGIKYFTELKSELEVQKQNVVTGEQAFFLYDTLGFPIDLTEQMALEANLSVDAVGFKNAMEEQKQRSRIAQRAARLSNGEQQYPPLELIAEQTVFLAEQGVLVTDDGFKYRLDVPSLPATVMAIYTSNGFLEGDSSSAEESMAVEDDFVGLVLDKTSFYSEAGGQETDIGTIELLHDDGTVSGILSVTDVQTYGGYVLHKGVIESGQWKVGMHVNCRVDYDRRCLIAPNHSMTHVLNGALRTVLGDGVDQRGSLCNAEKLRFDFSHKKAMTLPELQKVEKICQSVVAKGEKVSSEMMPLADAKQIDGVRAVFGEVYPDPVRVIRIGDNTSIEFCGGTHVKNTAEAEAFVLIEETAVAKGIRRISAVTKTLAMEAIESGKKFLSKVEELEKVDPTIAKDLDKRAAAIRKDLDAAIVSACLKADLRLRIEEIQKIAAEVKLKDLQKRVDIIVNDLKVVVEEAVASQAPFLVTTVDVQADTKTAQKITNAVKKIAPKLPFLAISEEEPGSGGKVLAFAIVPDDVVTSCRLQADDWVRAALGSCSGRGGGKPNSAQAQAPTCVDLAKVHDDANVFAQTKTATLV
jgi:alanyl-tRNA synthetase